MLLTMVHVYNVVIMTDSLRLHPVLPRVHVEGERSYQEISKRVYQVYIITIIAVTTLFSIYLLGSLHQSQTVSEVRLRQRKEIHPIP